MADTGFPYVSNQQARILVLGSMPGRKSLAEQQYYAHPQNAFWPIMADLLGFDAGLAYEDRLARLRQQHVALWDVAHQCIRSGSLDSAIETESVIANDFIAFFNDHPHIRAIFFNGRKSAELFGRLVQPHLPESFSHIEQYLLPSTSPAHAGMTRAEKLETWKIIIRTLEKV
ncbi:MAG: DNA-deoxyinosine glycosylase [Mariprofundus sp.]